MASQDELIEQIEIALVDWKSFAQPADLTELAELLLDVRDASDPDEIKRLEAQFQHLESFVASRKASDDHLVVKK